MNRRKVVLAVAAAAALVVTGAPYAGATPSAVPGSLVLEGLPGSRSTHAADINNKNVVVGTSDWRPVRWDSIGRVTALPIPSDLSQTYMGEIHESGFIIGNGARDNHEGGSLTQALLWSPSAILIPLQYLPGGTETRAGDFDGGVVAGAATDADGVWHAVWWDVLGRVTELSALPGGNSSGAVSVNSRGTIVGSSDVVVAGTHVSHAALWNTTGWTLDLGAPYSEDSAAVGINEGGRLSAQWAPK